MERTDTTERQEFHEVGTAQGIIEAPHRKSSLRLTRGTPPEPAQVCPRLCRLAYLLERRMNELVRVKTVQLFEFYHRLNARCPDRPQGVDIPMKTAVEYMCRPCPHCLPPLPLRVHSPTRRPKDPS